MAAPSQSATVTTLADAQAALGSQNAQVEGLSVVDVTLNNVRKGDAMAYFGANREIFLEEAALRRWQILVPENAAEAIDERRFVPISKLPGAKAKLDVRSMEVLLTVPAQLFEAHEVMFARQAGVALSPPPWAGFFNYDLFGYWQKQNSYGAGLFEAGVSGPYGSGIATFAANNSQASGGTSGQLLRYETSWRYDEPAATRTLIVGDTMTRAGAWGNALRFGGVQVGTNFSLQPNLITYPLQAVSGQRWCHRPSTSSSTARRPDPSRFRPAPSPSTTCQS